MNDCPSDAELLAWERSELSARRDAEMGEHVGECPKCGPRAVELELLGQQVEQPD